MIITATSSTSGAPSVDLLVDAMPAGAVSVSVFRSFDGSRTVIRDANRAATGGASSRPYNDSEVPFGFPVTYTAYAYSAAGAQLTLASSGAVTVESEVPWISDPLAPLRACAVVLINDSLQEIAQDTPGDIASVVESSLPVAVMGTTQEASSVNLTFLAPTALQGLAIRTVLLSANPFLLRLPPSYFSQLKPLTYVAHTSYTNSKVSRVQRERDHISLSGVAVAPPVSPVVLAKRTYADLLGEASSYGDLPEMYTTYLTTLRGERAD